MAVPTKQKDAVASVKKRGEKGRVSLIVAAVVAAAGSGWLYKKNPTWRTLGTTTIPTGIAVGAGGVLLGLMGKGRAGNTIAGVGLGFLLPAIAAKAGE